MEVFIKVEGDVLIVKVTGELDMHTVDYFKNTIIQKMNKHSLQHLVLNFTEVSFIDSSGLGAILGRYRFLDKKRGQIILVGLRPAVKKVFKLAGMLKIIREVDNEQQALMELNEGGL